MSKKILPPQTQELLQTLKLRFEHNLHRHQNIDWSKVQSKLESNSDKLWSLYQMENTGGGPDIVSIDSENNQFIFIDCSPESPSGRRSLCYDRQAFDSRKANKPKDSALDMAASMGIELLTEEDYFHLQTLGNFDTKTSSWLQTPNEIRKLGGALYGDRRYSRVFVYHNGAESYYASRGFRGLLRI